MIVVRRAAPDLIRAVAAKVLACCARCGQSVSVQTNIRPFERADVDAVVHLSLRAWEPVFASFRQVLGREIERELHGPDWREYQQRAVEEVCASTTASIWVADCENDVVGFVAVELLQERGIGEIYMLAVDPDYQDRGLGGSLTVFALERMKDAGMVVGMVGTGGDPGHAPARRTYEKTGFQLMPMARYFKML